jgi:SWIM zinc finger
MARWTVEQVIALAPDDSARKSAKGLASPRTWAEMGSNDTLVWGKCQGSGKEPYQVTVDLNGPAFRCTCPSRKFPCKHGLALLMLWSANDGTVGDSAVAAPFADEWAAQRSEKTEKQAAKSSKKAEQLDAESADPAIREKREAARIAKISAGLNDLQQWMSDLVRQGIAAAQSAPYSFWDTPAARLVDAQAPGVADRVRDLASLAASRSDWADRLLIELGRIHLLAEAWTRRDSLPAHLQADLRTAIGWSRSLDEVRLLGGVEDDWVVLGVRQDGEGKRVRSQRSWLWGATSQQFVVVLDFATGGGGFGIPMVTGSTTHGTAFLFPGGQPNRALIDDPGPSQPLSEIPRSIGSPSLETSAAQISSCIATNPWLTRVPVVLHDVTVSVSLTGTVGTLIDSTGASHVIGASNIDGLWRLLLHALDAPCSLVCEYEDGVLWPLSVSTPDGWLSL